jgi:hypothetical protein
MILDWELPSTNIIKNLHHVEVGSNIDATLGFSETSEEGSIIGFGTRNERLFQTDKYDIIAPEDYCVVRGQAILPFRTKAAIERIDLFNETLEISKEIFTNSKGAFLFLGVPGELLKVKISKENFYTFMVVPNEVSINFDDVDGLYGYRLDLNQHAI